MLGVVVADFPAKCRDRRCVRSPLEILVGGRTLDMSNSNWRKRPVVSPCHRSKLQTSRLCATGAAFFVMQLLDASNLVLVAMRYSACSAGDCA